MARKPKAKIYKSVFQIRYTPVLSFYENLFKEKELFKKFPHWQTDRLKVILRDYKQRHSVVIKHDSITYDTDDYKKNKEEEIISLIDKEISSIIKKPNMLRFGHRFRSLVPVDMNFEDLVQILNLKTLSQNFINVFDEEPSDLSISLIINKGSLNGRFSLGPAKRDDIPNIIGFSIEHHIEQSSIRKYSEMAKIFESYPENSLFIDLDIYTEIPKKSSLLEFWNESNEMYSELTDNLFGYILKTKLK